MGFAPPFPPYTQREPPPEKRTPQIYWLNDVFIFVMVVLLAWLCICIINTYGGWI